LCPFPPPPPSPPCSRPLRSGRSRSVRVVYGVHLELASSLCFDSPGLGAACFALPLSFVETRRFSAWGASPHAEVIAGICCRPHRLSRVLFRGGRRPSPPRFFSQGATPDDLQSWLRLFVPCRWLNHSVMSRTFPFLLTTLGTSVFFPVCCRQGKEALLPLNDNFYETVACTSAFPAPADRFFFPKHNGFHDHTCLGDGVEVCMILFHPSSFRQS